MIKDKYLSINEGLILEYSNKGNCKLLHMYAVICYLTAGLGYIPVEECIQKASIFCSVTQKTLNNWITKLHNNKLIRIRKGVIYIRGKKELEKIADTTQRTILFYEEHLKSYSNFQAHVIRQVALLTQRRFKYSFKHLRTLAITSLVNTGIVEATMALVKSPKKVGCSISKVQEKLGFDKMTISRALRGYTVKQWNETLPIKGKVARVKYKDLLNDITGSRITRMSRTKTKKEAIPRRLSHKWSYTYNEKNDTYVFRYAIASKIRVESYLGKSH